MTWVLRSVRLWVEKLPLINVCPIHSSSNAHLKHCAYVHYRKYLLKNVSKIVKIVHSANSAVGVFSLHNAYSVIPFGNWIFIACRMCSFLNSENINCPELERSDQKRSDHDKKVCDWDHFSAKLPIHSHPIWQGINFFDHFFFWSEIAFLQVIKMIWLLII